MSRISKCQVDWFQQVATVHTTSSLLEKQYDKKFKLSRTVNDKVHSQNDNKKPHEDYMKLLNKAEKSINTPRSQRVSRMFYNLTKSLSSRNGQKTNTASLKPRKPLFDTSSFSSSIVKCFDETPEDFSSNLDIWSSTFPDDDELKRLFLFQECLSKEVPFHAEIPMGANENTFLKSPKIWEEDMIHVMPMKDRVFQFLMLKWALKNKDKRKKEYQVAKSAGDIESEPLLKRGFPKRLFPMFSKAKIRRWNMEKLACSYHFLQPLLIDMRFHKAKNENSSSLMTQLNMLFMNNFASTNPFHLVLANFDQNSEFYHKVWNRTDNTGLATATTITNKSFHELEPTIKAEDFIYLSPDASAVMTEFDHNKTYIIGGLVDRYVDKYRTKTISKTESISTMRLPLHLYLTWGGIGGKMELTVNVVFDIINTLKHTGCWIEALSCIPYRLHSGLSELGQELANYDPEVISRFDAGRQWKAKHLKKRPSVHLQMNPRKRPGLYLGKS